jgi:hypothetical protein
MTSMGKIQAHQSLVRLHDGLVDLQIGRAPAQSLNIDPPLLRVKTKSLESTSLAEKFNLIDVLVSTVVTSTGVAFGILV